MTGLVRRASTQHHPEDARGRDLVARPVSPDPPADALLDRELTGRSSASRAGQDILVVQSSTDLGDVVLALGIGMHGVVTRREVVVMP
jgi:hypothetical protein